MFLNKIKLLTSILVAILMISVSANVIAFNQDTTRNETNGVIEDVIELENTNLEGELVTTSEVITKELPLERVSPSEILEELPYLADMENMYPTKYLEGQDYEPYTLNVDDYTGDTVIPPEQLLRLTDSEGPGATPFSTRGSRADAGDDPGTATELFDGGNWTGDWTSTYIDPNPQPHYVFNDRDWFAIWVREKGSMKADYVTIRIENTAPASTSFTRDLHCYMFEPLSVMLNGSIYRINGPNLDKTISHSDGEVSQKYIDAEIIGPGENATLNAAPSITSYFFIWVLGLSDIDINYNITSVAITEIQRDNNNYPDNATIAQDEAATNQQVEQHKDHWDWYDISGSFDYIGPKWDNKASYTVDIKTEERGPGNDAHSWTEVFVLYDDDPGNTLYINGDERKTGGSPSRSGTDPIIHSFITPGSHAWLGIRTWSMVVSSTSGNYLQTTFNGKVLYDLSYSIEIQNINPSLDQAKREPELDYHFLEDQIKFKVRYRDLDNDAPDYVRVTVDGLNYKMTSSQTNYVTGATFTKTLECSDLGLSPYPHKFNFSATDGQVPISLTLSSPKDEFYIIQNQTPHIFDSAPDTITMEEDDDVKTLLLNQIFEDVDLSDGMDFKIYQDGSWGRKFESDTMEVFFSSNNKNLQIQLKENQHGSDDVRIRAKETLFRSTDTYEFLVSHKLNITVTPVNDAPILDPITNVQGHQGFKINVPVMASDPDIITDIDVPDKLTWSINRTNPTRPDYIEGLALVKDDTDPTGRKANITFTPQNEHVGRFILKVTVTDERSDEDSQDLEFEILNVNDDPLIIEVATDKETKNIEPDTTSVEFKGKKYGAKEDEWFNMTVKIVDIDLSIGESNDIEFNLENSTFSSAVNIDHSGSSALSAEISILPRDYDVGTNIINLSVHDGKGGSDYIEITVEVQNVNDPPEMPEILKPEGQNNTFSVVEDITFEGQCDDEDFYITDSNEMLTYFWKLEYSDKIDELNRGTTTSYTPFSFKMRPMDRHLQMDEYTIRLMVRDNEKEEHSITISISISEDFDGDEMPDQWEYDYGLDYKDRKDAIEDKDGDGASNLEEYKANTNPYDPTDKPGGKDVEADYTWAIIAAAIVIILIILLVIFMVIQKRRAAKTETDDLSSLAYPTEEGFEMEMAQPVGMGGAPPGMVGPGPGQGQGPGGPGMQMPPGMPSQFMAMNPMQRMQMMQQMQQMQQQQGQSPGQGTAAGPVMGMQDSKSITTEKIEKGTITGTDKEPQLDMVSLKPQLPSKNGAQPEGDMDTEAGRHSPIDSVSHDELSDMEIEDIDDPSTGPRLVPGSPGLISESEATEAGITESGEELGTGDISLGTQLESETDENRDETGEEEMKCPNCGTPVKSGWFLCPACKSPIN